MRDCVRAEFFEFTRRFEGLVLHMYLDVKSLCTIGLGNLIDPHIPACLDFRDLHGIPATTDQVQAEWAHIKSLTSLAPLGGTAFRPHAHLRATEASVRELVERELDGFWSILCEAFPDAEQWPADAQLGLLSIAWACGPHFPSSWPKFTAAARAQDWPMCAAECGIATAGNPGVVPRNAATRTLFMNAAATSTPDQLSP